MLTVRSSVLAGRRADCEVLQKIVRLRAGRKRVTESASVRGAGTRGHEAACLALVWHRPLSNQGRGPSSSSPSARTARGPPAREGHAGPCGGLARFHEHLLATRRERLEERVEVPLDVRQVAGFDGLLSGVRVNENENPSRARGPAVLGSRQPHRVAWRGLTSCTV